jgi:hypothetical protein
MSIIQTGAKGINARTPSAARTPMMAMTREIMKIS